MSKQSLDPDLVLSCLKYGDLYYLLNDNEGNYSPEEFIQPIYIKGLFDSFREVSDYWKNLVGQIQSFVTEFDNVDPPNIDTDLSELDFLGFSGIIKTESGNLNVRSEGNTNSSVLDKIPRGTRVNVVEKDGKFWKVQYASYDESGNLVNKEGYVSSDYVVENPNNSEE